MAYHNPKERSEEFLAEVRYKWRLNELGQLVVNNKYPMSKEVGSVFSVATNNRGYQSTKVKGVSCCLAHLVWYLHTGDWPKQPLDHINGDKLNNHPDNLRLSTTKENSKAFRRVKAGASSKWRGVCFNKWASKWKSAIRAGGKNRHVGYFICEKEAALAYNYAALKYSFPPEAFNQVFANDDEVEAT